MISRAARIQRCAVFPGAFAFALAAYPFANPGAFKRHLAGQTGTDLGAVGAGFDI